METKNNQKPICKEPWNRLYILRRGVWPCCYGYKKIADMKDYKKAWNNKEMQEIRAYLARGELSDYCLSSKSCPIVKRHYFNIDNKKRNQNLIKRLFSIFIK